ncbi:MAG: PAS domain-containing protein [Candidatus Omnitrophota bacterium]
MDKKEYSSEGWREIFDSIADLIFIQDENYVIVDTNKAFTETLGGDRKKIIGKRCYELLHKRNSPWPGCPFTEAKKDGFSHSEEVDDKNIGTPLLVTVSPMKDKDGKITGMVHIAKDISRIKETERRLTGKMRELERFNKAAVGREIRMIELKKKIKELEEELARCRKK